MSLTGTGRTQLGFHSGKFGLILGLLTLIDAMWPKIC